MKLFPTTVKTSRPQRLMNTIMLGAVIVLAATGASTALADRTYTTVVRETVYHTPSRVIVSPTVIVPVSNSVYIGFGGGGYVSHQPRQTVVYREVTRHNDRYDDHHYRGNDHRNNSVWGYSSRGNGWGHRNKEPVRGRWSGSDRRRDVIYVEKDGRRNSSYRETERRSVEIRDRSR